MSRLVALIAVSGCITFGDDTGQAASGGGSVSDGTLTVDGENCPIDVAPYWGFCLTGDVAFSVDGGGECNGVDWRATAWLPPTALDGPDTFTLQPDSVTETNDQGAVWVDVGDQTWTTTSGSLTLSRDGDDVVTATFEAQLQDFMTAEPGPTASGTMRCEI
jgi:hypothetical protein